MKKSRVSKSGKGAGPCTPKTTQKQKSGRDVHGLCHVGARLCASDRLQKS